MVGNRNSVYPDLPLVQDGVACAALVLAENPTEKARLAATDLCDTIEKMSGAHLPLISAGTAFEGTRILVGESRETVALGYPAPHGYPENERVILCRKENCLIVLGNDDGVFTGTQFAATMLLERLGCGWYGLKELWQVIPQKKTLSVGYLNINQTPRFTYRQTHVSRRNRDLALRWYMGGCDKQIDHAYFRLFPREQYFEAHPEWYCLVDGKRNPYVEWWQMCYSNPEVVQETIRKIDTYFLENPSCTQAALSANDGYFEGFCECEECRKLGTPGETMVWFVNQVAQGLEDRHPDKQLMFFIYFPTYDPPRRKMPLHKNVTLMFCKESCMFHAVDNGPDCGYHIRYEYDFGHTYYTLPFLENARKWIEMTDCRHTAVWDWYCPAAANPVWKDLPWVQGDVATRNQLCFERDLGAEYIYYDQGPVEAFHDTETSYPLRWPLWYVAARGMWDGRQTASQILMDACKKLFGSAADAMFAYYSCLADVSQDCHAKGLAWHMPEPYELYTPEAICRIDRTLSAVEALLPQLSGDERRRTENQLALWRRAKEVIADYHTDYPDESSRQEKPDGGGSSAS